METCCDFCAYNEYDEDDEEYNKLVILKIKNLQIYKAY